MRAAHTHLARFSLGFTETDHAKRYDQGLYTFAASDQTTHVHVINFTGNVEAGTWRPFVELANIRHPGRVLLSSYEPNLKREVTRYSHDGKRCGCQPSR